MPMTPTQAYVGKKKSFEAWIRWYKRLIARFYPDTGGISLHLHNWHICKGDEFARHIHDAPWDAWRRMATIWDRAYKLAEHRERHRPDFAPFWCEFCHPPDEKQPTMM